MQYATNIALLHNIPLLLAGHVKGPYTALQPSEEELQGAAQHQYGIMVQEDVTREFFNGGLVVPMSPALHMCPAL